MNSVIFKSSIVFVFCCMLYSLLISKVELQDYKPINQLQGNLISKEDFYFDDAQKNTHYLVGSSLTYRLKENYLPDYYENLSMGGSSSLNGLSILASKDIVPKVLIVETNILTRTKNLISVRQGVKKKLFGVEEEFIKSNLKITRQKYQPVSFVLNLGYSVLRKGQSVEQVSVSPKAKALMQKKQAEEYSLEVEQDSSMLVIMDNLQYYLDYYIDKGTCVVFMEMPISCDISSSPKAVSSRKLMRAFFPPSEYDYMDTIECDSIATTDGTHLDSDSARMMIDHILRELEKNRC